MSIGIGEIDEDHRRLIGFINDLDAAVNASRFTADAVAPTLDGLKRWAPEHFRREERLMQAARYPRFAEHKRQHDLGLAALAQLLKNYAAFPLRANAKEIHQFLSAWLVKHLILEDREIAAHLAATRQRD